MARFFLDLAIAVAVFVPFCLFTLAVLWRLKSKGTYTILLALFFMVVFQVIGLEIAPRAMEYHRRFGMPPVQEGLALGCGIPMVFMLLYHFAERRKNHLEQNS